MPCLPLGLQGRVDGGHKGGRSLGSGRFVVFVIKGGKGEPGDAFRFFELVDPEMVAATAADSAGEQHHLIPLMQVRAERSRPAAGVAAGRTAVRRGNSAAGGGAGAGGEIRRGASGLLIHLRGALGRPEPVLFDRRFENARGLSVCAPFLV